MFPPDIAASTTKERDEYIREHFKCISNCEMCGNCKVFKGKEPAVVFADYIEGIASYNDCYNRIK